MLQKIGTKMLVEHALDRVLEAADSGQIWLASDSSLIAAVAEGKCFAVVTSANCRSGTDRCAEVADINQWPDDDVIVNVQADMPFLNPEHLRDFLETAQRVGEWDVVTGFCDYKFVHVRHDGFRRDSIGCHVGLYAYKRHALRRFATLPTSAGEERERLEQLRAYDYGFDIAYHEIPEMPLEVNTPQDLAAAQHIARCLQ